MSHELKLAPPVALVLKTLCRTSDWEARVETSTTGRVAEKCEPVPTARARAQAGAPPAAILGCGVFSKVPLEPLAQEPGRLRFLHSDFLARLGPRQTQNKTKRGQSSQMPNKKKGQ